MYKVVKAPIPTETPNSLKGTSIYPFASLELDESFFVPIHDNAQWHKNPEPGAKWFGNLKTHVSRHNLDKASTVGKRFKVRVWPDNNLFAQIWRVK